MQGEQQELKQLQHKPFPPLSTLSKLHNSPEVATFKQSSKQTFPHVKVRNIQTGGGSSHCTGKAAQAKLHLLPHATFQPSSEAPRDGNMPMEHMQSLQKQQLLGLESSAGWEGMSVLQSKRTGWLLLCTDHPLLDRACGNKKLSAPHVSTGLDIPKAPTLPSLVASMCWHQINGWML